MNAIKRDACIAAGVVALMICLAGVFFYLPQNRKLKALESDIATHKAMLVRDAEKVAVVPDLLKQVEEMKSRYKDFDRKLPQQRELSGFLKEISTELSAESLANQLIEPGSPKREDLYHRLPIIMRFQGSHLALTDFLQKVEKMERLTRVEKLNARVNQETGTLDIELRMNIYFSES